MGLGSNGAGRWWCSGEVGAFRWHTELDRAPLGASPRAYDPPAPYWQTNDHIAATLVEYVQRYNMPSHIDWTRAVFMGVPVSDLTTAATFPGHEEDVREIGMRRVVEMVKRDMPEFP